MNRPDAPNRADVQSRSDGRGSDDRACELSRHVTDLRRTEVGARPGTEDARPGREDPAARYLPACSITGGDVVFDQRSGSTDRPQGKSGPTRLEHPTPGGVVVFDQRGNAIDRLQERPTPTQLEKPAQGGAAAMLMDSNASPQQQLAAVRELSKLGISNLTVQGKDGQNYNLRLEREPAGSREMVHLHMTGPDGKERVVLRGIANQDGSFTQERNRSGQHVDWYGSAGAKFKAINPNDATPGDGTNDQRPPYRPRPSDDAPVVRPPFKAPEVPAGSINRSLFDEQLKDPRVMAAFAGRMSSEVGSQGPAAQLAFAEEVMNRAMARNQTLMQALTGSYYPTHNPGSSRNPALVEAITKAWKEGTDTIYGATGNASGRVGFGVPGGHYDSSHHWVSPNQTVNINGERFGYEQVDINKGWLKKYQQLKTGSPM